MKRLLFIAVIASMILAGFTASAKRVTKISAFTPQHRTTFLRDNMDGTIVVRVVSDGKYRQSALHNAAKYAIRDLLFEGIQNPENKLMERPLIGELNAKEKYEDFANEFLKAGGDYAQFFDRVKDRKKNTNVKSKGNSQLRITTTVTINRAGIKAYLKEKGIIK